jgi:hypothetical protein
MSLWESIKGWFVSNRHQILCVPIPDQHATTTLKPEETYFALWLTHSFLKRDRAWLKRYFPAAHVSVRLDVAGETRTLTKLARPADGMVGPGVWANYPITGLLPYNGGTVEVEAGLTALETSTFLGAAVDVIDDFSSLVVPPVSEALAVAGKVANSVQILLDAGKGEIFLGMHQAYTSPGGGGDHQLGPQYLAVIGATHQQLDPAALIVRDSILQVRQGDRIEPLEGYDYLLFRFEARRERDDWRFPRFETLIRSAKQSFYAGETQAFERHRDDVLAEVLNSPDLTLPDRRRVALAIRDEINEATSLGVGAIGSPSRNLEEIMEQRAISLDHPLASSQFSLRDLVEGTV